jgi:hypothetical protein
VRGKAFLILPVVIAVALAIWQSRLEYGWLEMALGGQAWLFWSALLLWAMLVGVALKRHRAWWLLLTAPLILYPAALSALVLAACARGDCL